MSRHTDTLDWVEQANGDVHAEVCGARMYTPSGPTNIRCILEPEHDGGHKHCDPESGRSFRWD